MEGRGDWLMLVACDGQGLQIEEKPQQESTAFSPQIPDKGTSQAAIEANTKTPRRCKGG